VHTLRVYNRSSPIVQPKRKHHFFFAETPRTPLDCQGHHLHHGCPLYTTTSTYCSYARATPLTNSVCGVYADLVEDPYHGDFAGIYHEFHVVDGPVPMVAPTPAAILTGITQTVNPPILLGMDGQNLQRTFILHQICRFPAQFGCPPTFWDNKCIGILNDTTALGPTFTEPHPESLYKGSPAAGLHVPVITQVDAAITVAGGTDDILLPAILAPDADNELIHFCHVVFIPPMFAAWSLAAS
jgi:hypothetical protein